LVLNSRVGIFSKAKNFFTSLPSKVSKYAPQFFGKLSDVLDSDVAKKLIGLAEPALNSVIPGLGTGLSTTLPQLSKFSRGIGNFGKGYIPSQYKPVKEVPFKRPNELHERIQLKALPAPDSYNGPTVEEID
jgi:hypothetical protein